MPKRTRRTKGSDGRFGRWGVALGILGLGLGGLTFVMSRFAVPWWGLAVVASLSLAAVSRGGAMLIHQTWPRRRLIAAYVIAVVIGSGLFWIFFWPRPLSIFLVEGYASEWSGFLPGHRVTIKDSDVLKNSYRAGTEQRLSLRVRHEIPRTTLGDVNVFLWIPNDITVRTLPKAGPRPNEDYWVRTDVSGTETQYRLGVLRVPSGVYIGPDADLFLTFQAPGVYRLRYSITGSTHSEGFDPIRGHFTIEMTK